MKSPMAPALRIGPPLSSCIETRLRAPDLVETSVNVLRHVKLACFTKKWSPKRDLWVVSQEPGVESACKEPEFFAESLP